MSPYFSLLHEVFHPHSLLWHYLWLAPHLLQFVIAGLMISQSRFWTFPMFFAYTSFQAVKETLLFAMDHCSMVSPSAYWYAYGVGLAGDVILRFAVIHETSGKVLLPYPGLAKLGRLLLGWLGPLLLLVAVAVAWFAPGVAAGRITYGYQLIDRTVSLVQSGVLIFLFLFASYFGITWRNFTFGIALGMGVFSSVSLLTMAIRVAAGPFLGDYVLDFILMLTYHISVLIWLAYLLAPDEERKPTDHLPQNNLEQWNSELERLLRR